MVRIRLRRVGLRNQPSYRIVAANSESPRDGRFLENLGHYNPRTEPYTLVVNEDKVYHWMGNGAQLSEPVERLFRNAGILDRFERFKKGEDIETLLEESQKYFSEREVDPKTR